MEYLKYIAVQNKYQQTLVLLKRQVVFANACLSI